MRLIFFAFETDVLFWAIDVRSELFNEMIFALHWVFETIPSAIHTRNIDILFTCPTTSQNDIWGRSANNEFSRRRKVPVSEMQGFTSDPDGL